MSFPLRALIQSALYMRFATVFHCNVEELAGEPFRERRVLRSWWRVLSLVVPVAILAAGLLSHTGYGGGPYRFLHGAYSDWVPVGGYVFVALAIWLVTTRWSLYAEFADGSLRVKQLIRSFEVRYDEIAGTTFQTNCRLRIHRTDGGHHRIGLNYGPEDLAVIYAWIEKVRTRSAWDTPQFTHRPGW